MIVLQIYINVAHQCMINEFSQFKIMVSSSIKQIIKKSMYLLNIYEMKLLAITVSVCRAPLHHHDKYYKYVYQLY